jgi:chromosome segregation ATPase
VLILNVDRAQDLMDSREYGKYACRFLELCQLISRKHAELASLSRNREARAAVVDAQAPELKEADQQIDEWSKEISSLELELVKVDKQFGRAVGIIT